MRTAGVTFTSRLIKVVDTKWEKLQSWQRHATVFPKFWQVHWGYGMTEGSSVRTGNTGIFFWLNIFLVIDVLHNHHTDILWVLRSFWAIVAKFPLLVICWSDEVNALTAFVVLILPCMKVSIPLHRQTHCVLKGMYRWPVEYSMHRTTDCKKTSVFFSFI